MKYAVWHLCSLVWIAYLDVGQSLPNLNATDSSPVDHQMSGNGSSSQVENEDSKQKTMNLETGHDMEGPQFNYRPQENVIPNEWMTRGIFSERRNWRRQRRDMSPRSLFQKRRFGYFGGFPGGFRRYAPYGPNGRNQFMGNYESYPQTFGGSPMYDQAPFAQALLNGQQTQFSSQSSQLPYVSSQLYAPAQPHYRDPFVMPSQQQQQLAASTPYSQSSRVNAPPQYHTTRPGAQWGNQQRPIGSAQFTTPTRPTASQMMPTNTSQDARYQPTNLEFSRAESFDQFGAPVRPSDERDGTGSRIRPVQRNRAPLAGSEIEGTGSPDQLGTFGASTQGNRDSLAGPELQRPGSLDQSRIDERGSFRPGGNRGHGDPSVESDRQLTESNDQLRTSVQPADRRDANETPAQTASASGGTQPLSGLFSLFRSPSATTTESTHPQSRSIVDSEPLQQTREQPAPAQVALPAAVAA